MTAIRFPVSVTERVRFADLDAFGHLNNAVYIIRGEDAIAEGKEVLDYFDYEARKKTSLTPELRARVAKIEGWPETK